MNIALDSNYSQKRRLCDVEKSCTYLKSLGNINSKSISPIPSSSHGRAPARWTLCLQEPDDPIPSVLGLYSGCTETSVCTETILWL